MSEQPVGAPGAGADPGVDSAADPAPTSPHPAGPDRSERSGPPVDPATDPQDDRAVAQSLPLDIAAAAFDRLDDPPVTGDPRVDDALARLTELPDLPVAEHLPVYEDVHRRLHDALADLDAG